MTATENKMKIRKMTIEDYGEMYELWSSCSGIGLNRSDDSKVGIGKFIERNPETCFVAEEEGKVVGTIMAGNDGRRGYIYHTAVAPEYRERGIGSGLVNAALRALKQCGINKAALIVLDKNEIGNEFWERRGFTVRGDLVYRNKVIDGK